MLGWGIALAAVYGVTRYTSVTPPANRNLILATLRPKMVDEFQSHATGQGLQCFCHWEINSPCRLKQSHESFVLDM